MCPDACRGVRISVGAIRGRAVVGQPERLGGEEPVHERQKLENPLGRAITGNFRTTNLGVVMAESGLRPTESLLNNRSRRHVGQWMVHFSEYFGRVEEIFLPEDGPTELGANISR